MRLLTVLLILTITYAKKHRRLKNVKPEKEEGATLDKIMKKSGPEDFQRYYPVPFGHIYKEGVDPKSPAPLDLMELTSYYVKDNPLIRQLVPQGLAQPLHKPKGFASPKDEFFYGPKVDKDLNDESDNDTISLDFVALHRRNVNYNPNSKGPTLHGIIAKRKKEEMKKKTTIKEPLETEHKEKYLARNTFELESDRRAMSDNVTWTTCKEFGRKADFHPKDIVDLDWVPFYVWSGPDTPMNSAQVHKFTYPTKKLVKKYKEFIGPHLNKTVDWEQPKLLLKETIEILLIAVDRRGLFDGIPFNEISDDLHKLGRKIILPQLQLRLKIVDPYLAMMICDHKYATIMANPGNEPDTYEDRIREAKLLNFKGTGNPVKRDLRREKWVAQSRKELEMEIEKNKFISTDY